MTRKKKTTSRSEQRVKRFLSMGDGVFMRDTTGDRITPIENPYEDPKGDEIKSVDGVREVRGGYNLEEV